MDFVIDVKGTGKMVGGLVGSGYGLTNCYNTGCVSGNEMVGGLAGESDDLSDCYSTGSVSGNDVVGGLVGHAGNLTNCYSTGLVTGSSSVGGLVGANRPENTVAGCFWDIQTSGHILSAGGMKKTTAEMQDPNTFMAAGWDFLGKADDPHDIWAEPTGGGYPILSWQLPDGAGLPRFAGGTGEPNDPYRISTAEDLNSIGHNSRLMQCHFKLVADLDLAGVDFYPIGDYYHPYRGNFDGNGHTVSHLTIKGEGDAGMFVWVVDEVKNLGVVDVNTGSGWYVGGLVGYNKGTVTHCYSTGAVTGCGYIGGLVGENDGTVTQSYSTGTVNATGQWSVSGGLVGWNYGAVTQCYSTGAAQYGLVGSNGGQGSPKGGSVIACFWDTQTSRMTGSSRGTGKTTAEMQTAGTFLEAGWDFVGETANGTEDIWWILEGQDYPRLWWELIPEN